MKMWTVSFDGSCRPNPGGIGYYAYMIHDGAEKVKEESGEIKDFYDLTEVFTEFYAVYKGLESLESMISGSSYIDIKGDSDVVIKILSKKWKAKKTRPDYKIYRSISEILTQIRKKGAIISFTWIPRRLNKECDFLSKGLTTDSGMV